AGRCPFWDAVGRRFFDMDYPQIERLTGGRSKAFIAELMPQAPIYVPLLPEAAQWAIGQLHPQAELPFSILLDEGFDTETYVDIFDGGPTVDARLAMLRTVRRSIVTRAHASRRGEAAGGDAGHWLIATTERATFRATLAPADHRADGLHLDEAARLRLGLGPAAEVRAAPLLDDEEMPR
ncbi:MAG: arginine N-succinyltransferase, partial [Rubrivivax sp.]